MFSFFGNKKSARRRKQLSAEERDKRIAKGIEEIESYFNCELSPSYREFLQNYDQVNYMDRTCDVYIDPETQDRVLYNFQIKKFLSINATSSDDVFKNYENYKEMLPHKGLIPIAFDQFRNMMCLDVAHGSIHFWDLQNSVDARLIGMGGTGSGHARLFFVSSSFLDFKERLYKVSKYT